MPAKRCVRQRLRIDRDGVGDGTVVHHVALRIDGEGRFLRQRPAGVAFELIQQEGRLVGRIRVARIPEIVGEIPLRGAAILVGTGLGKDLDFAVAQLVVFGRKRVLVDANLADRFLRRELAAAEAVHEDGSAVGTGRRSGKRRKIGCQIVRARPRAPPGRRRAAPPRWRCWRNRCSGPEPQSPVRSASLKAKLPSATGLGTANRPGVSLSRPEAATGWAPPPAPCIRQASIRRMCRTRCCPLPCVLRRPKGR